MSSKDSASPDRVASALAGFFDRMGRVLWTAHAADLKSLALKGVVVHPELRQMVKKVLPKLLDVLDLLVLVRAGCYRDNLSLRTVFPSSV